MRKRYFLKSKIFAIIILIISNTLIPIVCGINVDNYDLTKTSQILKISRVKNKNNNNDNTKYYALIAACSEYKNKRNNLPKPPLPPFPEKKLKYVYYSLIKSDNWDEENIILLLNSNATKDNIVQALIQISEILGPDDIFIFSWNGHGSKVLDVDGDEAFFDPDDTYDEIICPYDIEKTDDSFVNALTDDELDILFSNICSKTD